MSLEPEIIPLETPDTVPSKANSKPSASQSTRTEAASGQSLKRKTAPLEQAGAKKSKTTASKSAGAERSETGGGKSTKRSLTNQNTGEMAKPDASISESKSKRARKLVSFLSESL